MSYKIAVATSDGVNVDLKFGETKKFYVYEFEDGVCGEPVVRTVPEKTDRGPESKEAGDDNKKGCQGGCHGGGAGCGEAYAAVEILSDCRSVVCTKIGFSAQKQLERKAITYFDVACPVKTALEKISSYFEKTDRHISLAGK